MVGTQARRRLGEGLRHLVASTLTNLDFDDTLSDEWEESLDRGVSEVGYAAWLLYDDFVVHPLELTAQGRRDVARWILFIHSDLEFEWPHASAKLISWPQRIWRRLAGAPKSEVHPASTSDGDRRYWPFFRESDYLAALRSPRLLGRDLPPTRSRSGEDGC